MESAQLQQIVEIIQKSREIVIISHNEPSFDTMGAVLSLYLGIKNLGKTVSVVSPKPMTVEFSSFVGADKLTNELKKRNFLISLDYQDGSIEKVSYNIEGNKFNLVIEPRVGFEGFSEKNVTYGNSGATGDAIILLDVVDPASLDNLFSPDEISGLLKNKTTILLGRRVSTLGGTQYVDTAAATNVELVYDLLMQLQVKMNEDIASNILSAIYMTTQNFQESRVTAHTFLVASACLAAGGKRFLLDRAMTPPYSVPSIVPTEPVHEQTRAFLEPQFGGQVPGEAHAPASIQPSAVPGDAHHVAPQVQPDVATPPTSAPAPEDWLKPKIFKSSESHK